MDISQDLAPQVVPHELGEGPLAAVPLLDG